MSRSPKKAKPNQSNLFITNERGNITLTLILSAVILAMMLGLGTTIHNNSKQNKITSQRLAARNVESMVGTAMASSDICSCHFDVTQNPDAAGYGIDTTSAHPPAVQLTSVRSGCRFTDQLNVMATVDPAAPAGQVVDQIQLGKIQQVAPAEYSAELTMRLSAGGFQIAPIALPISLTVDLTAGTPTARPVISCSSGKSSAMTSCPLGYTMFGSPGVYGNFCIETDLHSGGPKKFEDAMGTCYQYNPPGFAAATLCPPPDLYRACTLMPTLLNMTSGAQWTGQLEQHWSTPGVVSQTGQAVVYAGGACGNVMSLDSLSALSYRCCVYAAVSSDDSP